MHAQPCCSSVSILYTLLEGTLVNTLVKIESKQHKLPKIDSHPSLSSCGWPRSHFGGSCWVKKKKPPLVYRGACWWQWVVKTVQVGESREVFWFSDKMCQIGAFFCIFCTLSGTSYPWTKGAPRFVGESREVFWFSDKMCQIGAFFCIFWERTTKYPGKYLEYY